MSDAAIYMIIWTQNGVSHLLDFDDGEMATDCGLRLEMLGVANVLVSGPQTVNTAKERLEAAAVRVYEATIARYQQVIAEQRQTMQEQSGTIVSLRVAGQMKPQRDTALA